MTTGEGDGTAALWPPVGAGRHRRTVDAGTPPTGFLREPEPTSDAERLFDDDRGGIGYVMNLTRMWAHLPAANDGLSGLMQQASEAGGLTFRQRCVLISAAASTLGDPYCGLAWGTRLAGEVGDDVAAQVLQGDDAGLSAEERALASWARRVTGDPNGTDSGDVQALRDAGFDDGQIFAVTLFVALRVAFSTVNDALGVRPDRALRAAAPAPVRAAVSYGRPAADDER